MEIDRIDAGVFHHSFDGSFQGLGGALLLIGRVEIHRIRGIHPVRKHLLEFAECFSPQVGKLHAEIGDVVRGDDPAPTRKGEHHQPGTGGLPGLCHPETPGHVQQLGHPLNANDPGLTKGRIQHTVVLRQGGGVRNRRLCPEGTPAAFEHHDRFVGRSNQVDETTSLFHGFQVHGNDFGLRVVDEVFQEVRFVHLELVSDRTDLGEPERGSAQNVGKETCREHAALNHQRDHPRCEHPLPYPRRHEGKDLGPVHVDQAHAVRAPKAQPLFLCDRLAPVLESPALRPRLGEPRGFDDHAPDPLGSALLESFRHGDGRDEDDRQVDLFGNVEDTRVTHLLADPVHAGIDRIEVIPETGLHVPEKLVSGPAPVCGSADQRDRPWLKKQFHSSTLIYPCPQTRAMRGERIKEECHGLGHASRLAGLRVQGSVRFVCFAVGIAYHAAGRIGESFSRAFLRGDWGP